MEVTVCYFNIYTTENKPFLFLASSPFYCFIRPSRYISPIFLIYSSLFFKI